MDDGIFLDAGSGSTLIQGNFIGLSAAGSAAIANGVDGLLIQAGSTADTIGGTASGARNVISGNTGNGVEFAGAGTSGDLVEGDDIGTDYTGTLAIPNHVGLAIDTGAAENTIGGTASGAGNVIAFNASYGVVVGEGATDPSTGNAIVNDSIRSNAGGGIDNDSSGLLTISGSTIASNSAGNGGGIDNNGFATLVIIGSTITGNAAGAGRWDLQLWHAHDHRLHDLGQCGALWGRRHLELRHDDGHGRHDLEQLAADHTAGAAASSNFGPLTLTDSTISDNAAKFAGGIWNGPPGTLTADNCTFAGDHASLGTRADGSGGGGAIYNSGSGAPVGRI